MVMQSIGVWRDVEVEIEKADDSNSGGRQESQLIYGGYHGKSDGYHKLGHAEANSPSQPQRAKQPLEGSKQGNSGP